MNKSYAYLLAGLLSGIIGSIAAATVSLPYKFPPRQAAPASQLNANFSTLLSAVNRIDRRVGTLEQRTAAPTPDRFTVEQIDATVRSNVTIAGEYWTIVQLQVPRFDSDEVYLLKFPAVTDENYGQVVIHVNGVYPRDAAGFSATRVTTINGFRTLVGESFSFNSQLVTNGRDALSAFRQTISATILLGPETRIDLHFPARELSEYTSNAGIYADPNDSNSVYPPSLRRQERPNTRQQLRDLLAYVSLRKKP